MGEKRNKEEIAEDYCFVCKDGGYLIVCEYGDCLKSYHPECVGKDPSFVETGGQYTCDLHSCFNCHKRSQFQCFVCPSSVCRRCLKISAFVCTREGKGFCNNCLKLAIMVEENVDVDSDGEKVDFEDRDTWEFLFMDYWLIVKKKEGIMLEELRKADVLLRSGKNYKGRVDLYELPEEEYMISDSDDMAIDEDDGMSFSKKPKGHRGKKMLKGRKSGSVKREFIGWASKELAEFLTSIGKDIEKPLTQFEVSDIIKEYVHYNQLFHPSKRKKVLCDVRLQSLFKRKALNRFKIDDLLERHFSDYQDAKDDLLYGVDEVNDPLINKRQKCSVFNLTDHKSKPNGCKEKVSEAPKSTRAVVVLKNTRKSCYAAVIAENIKLVYLKQSLVQKFLKTPETFESKVMDSFVRIKCDRTDFYMPRNSHQIFQVTGLKKASETYKIADTSTDILLQVSDVLQDIPISILSDDDFTEVDLEKKARNLHVDITNHWIEREIVVLQNQIDRANEKGWRREYPLLNVKQLLMTEDEQARLLNILPAIIADEEPEPNAATESPDGGEFEGNAAISSENAQKRENEERTASAKFKAAENEVEGVVY
ncbi:hypothetical protein QJS04_geneDACA001835 [Acorus gramineus]|uniref:Uncharacterized protein n=1 Tax=Acorus gramineus TaxID=55184 RepID=A0AAV9BFC5_ACOGR|nr:hypothetical protein QJS04_geneDACA001835 [Acorus gramineus]